LQILELTPCSHVVYSLIATRNLHAQNNQLVGRIPERGQTRLLNLSGSTSGNKKEKACVGGALTSCYDENNP